MNIGDRIRQKRIELNMSQDELAKKVGYKSRSSIQKIEASRDLPLKKVSLMAHALGCTESYLMGWEEDQELMPTNTVLPIFNETDEHLLKIIEYYKNATPEAQSVVETVLKSAQQKP